MNALHITKPRGLFLAAGFMLAGAAAVHAGPVTFNSALAPGERVEVSGSVVTLGPDIVLAAGAELVVHASEGVVFSPGADFSRGTLTSFVGDPALARQAPGAPAAFSATVGRNAGGVVLRYTLPAAGRVRVRVSDLRGKLAYARTSPGRTSGRYEEPLGFAPRTGGFYLVQLEYAGSVVTRRIRL